MSHFVRLAIQMVNSEYEPTRKYWRERLNVSDEAAHAMKQAGTGNLDADDIRAQLEALKQYREINASR